jgi:hypothetical protein
MTIRKPFIFLPGLLGIFIIISFIACKSKDRAVNQNDDPQSIFFDYQVTGSEEEDSVTILFHFRNDDIEGEAFRLDKPSEVKLDGETLVPDSSKMTGYYYEIRKSLGAFTGKHKIVFNDINGNTYQEDFSFQPFYLVNPPDEINFSDNLTLQFDGLQKEDYLLVLMTDTSFPGKGINRVDTIRNGKLVIYPEELKQLTPGPVQIIFTRELERPLKNTTKSGGRLAITYRLGREFILKE